MGGMKLDSEDAAALVEMQQDIDADASAIDIIAARVGGKAGDFLAGIASDLRRLEALMVKADLWEAPDENDMGN